jgi:hypothetical protein
MLKFALHVIWFQCLISTGIACTLKQCGPTYCNEFAGSISRWKFITLKVQYTTLDYGSQLF